MFLFAANNKPLVSEQNIGLAELVSGFVIGGFILLIILFGFKRGSVIEFIDI